MPTPIVVFIPSLSNNVMHDVAMDIGQTEIAACILKGQTLVIQSQLVQQRGM